MTPPPTNARPTYTTAEAADITGVPVTQIANAVRKGHVRPFEDAPRRGMHRKFSFNNLVEITIVARLYAVGMDTLNINAALGAVTNSWWKLVPDSEKHDTCLRRESCAALTILFTPQYGGQPLIGLHSVKSQMEKLADGCAGAGSISQS
jgi:hypothetical protein